MSSGSRPSLASDLGESCAARERRARRRAVSTTCTLSHSLLKRRNVVGVASSARTASRKDRGRRASPSSASPPRPSAGFQLASPSTGYGDASVKSIVSGQHETWPSSRWPRALAAAIASRSSNTALRVGAVVEQRRDHHRAAGAGGERFEERHRACARPWSACRRRGRLRPWRPPAPPARRRRPAARASAGRLRRCAPGSCCWRSRPRRRPSRRARVACICAISSSVAVRVAASAPITKVRTDEWPT